MCAVCLPRTPWLRRSCKPPISRSLTPFACVVQDAIPAGDPKAELEAAQQVVRELHRRLRQQLQRWADYRSLFLFLAFIVLYLAVLYCQRGAHASYQVRCRINPGLAGCCGVPSDPRT